MSLLSHAAGITQLMLPFAEMPLAPRERRLAAARHQIAPRRRRLPVVESYPGAAQEIMGIPRRGAGVEFLRQGLADFGIEGSILSANHDELDAITSAIVGSFFLAGQCEALRDLSVGALVIPDLRASGRTGMIIGISGRICAGKTTTARILEQNGFEYTRFSLVIDDEIAARGEQLNRATRQRIGIEINHTKGQRWLCEKVLERVSDKTHVVIDGLRFPEDHSFFIERFGSQFNHVHVMAQKEARARRYLESREDNAPFEIADSQPVEAKIDDLRSLSALVVRNESSIENLRESVIGGLNVLSRGKEHECLSPLS